MRCAFLALLGGLFSPRIDASAPRIGYSFRSFDPSQVLVEVNGGSPQSGTASIESGSVSAATAIASIGIRINLPLLSVADSIVIRFPNPTDALLADTRTQWYLNNGWDRYTYYAVSRAATHDPGASVCTSAILTGCLTAINFPAPNNDKRLVLVLMGPRALPTQTWPSANVSDYLELENSTTGNLVYEARSVSSTFNDRLGACPFQLMPASGAPLIVCN